MNYIRLPGTNALDNLKSEQELFEQSPGNCALFLLWQNAPSVIIGRHQNVSQEVDEAYAAQHNIPIVRRITGGGAVYHDLGNLNYSVIIDRSVLDKSLVCMGMDPDTVNLFQFFSQPVIDVLNGFGLQATFNGRNDIELNGLKISGSAQIERNGRILHHGTLLYDTDLTVMNRVLTPATEKLNRHSIASVRSRVTNLKDHLPADITLPVLMNQLKTAYESCPYEPE